MKLFTRSALLLMALFALLFSTAQAQDSCNLPSAADYRYAGHDAFWSGDYQEALRLYSCGIVLVPPNADLNLPLHREDPLAGLFLGRAWTNTMLGNTAETHADFYRWIVLTEKETIETSLQVAFSGIPVDMELGLVYRLSFDGNAGDTFSFSTESDENLDPLMVLLAPDGTAIASDDDGGAVLHADNDAHLLNIVLPESGRYRLVISQARSGTGLGEVEIIGEFTRHSQTAEAPCNLPGIADYEALALQLFWQGAYEQALERYNCGIVLVPADSEIDLPLAHRNPVAGLYIGRAWTNLMLGNVESTHEDFYRWIVLTEAQTVEQSLDAALVAKPLEMERGLVYRLSFEGRRGEMIGFSSLTQDAIDPLFVLLAPDGTVLIANDDSQIDPGGTVDSRIERFVLPETGMYTLVIAQAGTAGSGEMQLIDERQAELGFNSNRSANE